MGRRNGSRYLGILRGNDATARTQLLSYLTGQRKVTYPSRQGNRPAQLLVYLEPFNIPLTSTVRLEESVNATRWQSVSGFVAGFVTNTAPTAENRLRLPGVNSPRVLITTGRTASGSARTSELTGRSYKSYGGDSVSVPFGKGSGADQDTPAEVFEVIRTRVKTANNLNICSLVPGDYA